MSKVEKVHRYLAADNTVRVACLTATQLVDEMRSRQNSSPVATIASGRALIASVLMASNFKNGSVSLSFDGSGSLGKLYSEASFNGDARAYVGNPQATTEFNDKGNIDVGSAVGIGLLTVTHHQSFDKQPYRGTVIIKTGEIGEDIAFYLEQSLQIPSVVALAVRLNEYGMVQAAGGVLIEVMPGCKPEIIEQIEKATSGAKSISEYIMSGMTPQQIADQYMGGLELTPIEHEHSVRFACPCSLERVERSISLLGATEIEAMLSGPMPLEVSCEFCNMIYKLQNEDLQKLYKAVQKKSLN